MAGRQGADRCPSYRLPCSSSVSRPYTITSLNPFPPKQRHFVFRRCVANPIRARSPRRLLIGSSIRPSTGTMQRSSTRRKAKKSSDSTLHSRLEHPPPVPAVPKPTLLSFQQGTGHSPPSRASRPTRSRDVSTRTDATDAPSGHLPCTISLLVNFFFTNSEFFPNRANSARV